MKEKSLEERIEEILEHKEIIDGPYYEACAKAIDNTAACDCEIKEIVDFIESERKALLEEIGEEIEKMPAVPSREPLISKPWVLNIIKSKE